MSDSVRYNIQISTESDFSSYVINFTSALQSQGNTSYTVGQQFNGGSYGTGSQDQTLSNGSYYWRVRTIDNNSIASDYTVANSGNVAFTIGGIPDVPNLLGPIEITNGTTSTNNTPSFTFNLNDPDVSDTLKFQIQISHTNSFSSLILDYTSNFLVQGPTSFTVGQNANGGTYTIGSQGQSLASGNYYWRVRAIDNVNLTSNFSYGNDDSVAFRISVTPNDPTSLGPLTYTDGSLTSETRPTLTFNLSDSDVSDLVRFRIQISKSSDFSTNIIDYTSPLLTQGASSFTVGSGSQNGNFINGFLGQRLNSGNYYLRVKTIDQNNIESNFTNANNLSFAFELSARPDNPTTLGPESSIYGTSSINNNPSFTFTLSDPDITDPVRYQIIIDNNIDFSSPVVDFTSSFVIQDITLFTVGQPALGGTYSSGFEGQTLSSGDYFWRIRAYDIDGNSSDFSLANSGNIAFSVTQKTRRSK